MTAPTRPPQQTIRQLREEQGWSREGVASRLQASVRTIGGWERGRVPPPDQQQRLADLFGVSVEAIAFGPAEQEPQERL